ncbi:unnamed protein product [Mytilus coruscus]|uniref:Integrase zinc-binding domain-containing protein n=1 Tax=Mytilus coruscus TaxID=42192 RepID=A0A6J8D8H8_MYTCO|nr:unnamed protein product [Mytilus coruscus]
MWYEHKTNQEMFEAQKSDNVLFNLYRLKSDNNNRPEWADVALQDVKLKKYWSQWDRFVLINNVLYRKWINATTEESNLLFIVPGIWKENIMLMLHDDIQVGHFGIHKTVARAQNRFYWIATQTEDDRRVVQVTSATQTKRIVVLEKEVQTEVEESRIVVEIETETEEDVEMDMAEVYMDLDFYN